MPKFRYTAIDGAGKTVRGAIEAASAAMVADQLHGQGRLLLRADEVGSGGRLLDLLHADLTIERGLPKAVIGHFTRELSVMLSAGQDIDHALKFLVESSEDKRVRHILEAIRNQVRGGKALAVSLAEHPKVFSRLYISLVRAGEAGGNLAESLANLADLLEREAKLAATVQSAMIYPAFVFIFSVGIIVMLLTYVLPQFTPIFEQAGATLPRLTRIVMGMGDIVRDDGLWILLFILVATLAARQALKEPKTRIASERLFLRLPIVGALIRRSQAARFMRTLGTLLGNGVSLVSALVISRGVLGNLLASQVVDHSATEVKSGRRLAVALDEGKFFPIQTVHLIALGEETGQLSEMALRAADIHDEQVRQTVQRLVSIMVPVVTIVMGMVVLIIVASLLVAMLSLNDLAV